jgi:hypothetical protein
MVEKGDNSVPPPEIDKEVLIDLLTRLNGSLFRAETKIISLEKRVLALEGHTEIHKESFNDYN